MPAMAQKNSDVIIDGWTWAGTSNSYDRQTQCAVYPMTKRHNDGFIGCTWTNEDNSSFPGSSTPTRGVGYAYSTNNGQTWSTQEKRLGGIPVYWPSYAQWGANGEAVLARSADTYVHQGISIKNGLVLFTRPNKGQGAWTITPVPYPEGTSPEAGYTMAWARMATSGDNHQYIHIMSPMQLPTGQTYNGYYYPVFYYRTQDGGSTWDVAGELVPAMVGQEWEVHSQYNDAVTFADTHGDVVACSFIRWGNDGYVLRSYNNGDTWESIKFFDSPVGHYITPSQYADTCYIPTQGCIALDNNGKIHVAFSVLMSINMADEGYVGYFSSILTSFLSYWNESMGTIDGATEFVKHKIDPLLDDYFDWNQSDPNHLYVKSAVPKWPLIGYFTPTLDEHYFTIDMNLVQYWATTSYGFAGCFSFPQMVFDKDNTLHLTYLGLLDYGDDGNGHWLRHPFYTVTAGGAIWGETKHLVNSVDLIDREFAYLTLAGIDDNMPKQWIYLMAQVDPYAGTYTPYSGQPSDHASTTNYFYHFHIQGDDVEACYPVTNFTVDYTADCSKAELTWDAPEKDIFTYKIYRDDNLIATINNENSYTDEEFNPTVKHTWKVTVVCGSKESLPAGVTKGTCTFCNTVTDASATIMNCETATITWKAVAGAKGYKISRDGNLLSTVTTTEYTETAEFEYGTSYTWQIVTICAENESGEVEVTAMCICNSVTDIKTEVDCKTATITWKAVESAVGYNIVRDGIGIIHSVTVPKYTENDTFEDGETYKWKIETLCVNGGVSDPVEATAVADCVSINELTNSVAIYPNPTTGMITIVVTEFAKVEIYNAVGQLVETKTVDTFDVSSYNTGIYLFKVYNVHNNSVTKRVMVTK